MITVHHLDDSRSQRILWRSWKNLAFPTISRSTSAIRTPGLRRLS
jgi:hypothetical protein